MPEDNKGLEPWPEEFDSLKPCARCGGRGQWILSKAEFLCMRWGRIACVRCKAATLSAPYMTTENHIDAIEKRPRVFLADAVLLLFGLWNKGEVSCRIKGVLNR